MSKTNVPKVPRRNAKPRAAASSKGFDRPAGLVTGAPERDTSGTHVWLVLMKAFRALSEHAKHSMTQADLAFSEFTILEALLNKGPLQVNDIGRRVKLTSGAMTSATDRLIERGLVQRGVDDADARARLVSLTRAGRALITKTFDVHKATMDAVAETLTANERETLIDLLKKLGLGAVEKLPGT